MDIQAVIFGSLGGLAIFLFGMTFMSEGLKMIGSESFKRILRSLTKTRGSAILVGIGITCLIQSSSATSVMVVGFANAALLSLSQAIAVVLGADIGTTITAWIVSTMGIGKFKITAFALPIVAVGFLIFFVAKKRKRKMIGQAILGFGLLFLGLGIMSDGVKSIKESQMVMDLFQRFGQNPFLGILAGALVTCIIQSSSATIAIVQVMAFQNLFGLEAALPLMFGADIGTTITAQLAAIGGTRGARAVAMANSVFKLFGALLFVPLLVTGVLESVVLYFIPNRVAAETGTNGAVMAQIAATHSAYIAVNVIIFSTLLWPLLVKAAKRLARIKDDTEAEEMARSLDPILLDTPPIALEQCYKEVAAMTRLCRENITAAFNCFINKNLDAEKKIKEREETIDGFQTKIASYLVELSRRALSITEGRAIPHLIHCINDAERVGDHAENLCELTELQIEKKAQVSIEAKRDLQSYFDLVDQQFQAVIHALTEKDADSVSRVLELEEQINGQYEVIFEHHVTRLDDGTCTVHTGIIVMDVAANLEKIADHLTNIAERVEID
jgi:phosphate:Na+ symporter